MSTSIEQETGAEIIEPVKLPPDVQKYLDSNPKAEYVGCFDSDAFHLAASQLERPAIGVQFREGVPPDHKWHLVKRPHEWMKKPKTQPDAGVASATYKKSAAA